jgi:hypothetical protein
MTTMRPIRTIATALLIASLAVAGCGRGQPSTPPSQPPVTTAPTPKAPNPTPPTPAPTPRPRVLSITTTPTLPREGGVWGHVPPGAGTITFRVRAVNAQRVRFYLTPTGTAMFNENQLIGQDTNGRDGWSLTWRYPGGGMLAHLTVIAVGANGVRGGMPSIGLYQPAPEPAPRIVSVTTIPTLPREGGFLRLPAGAGTLVFRVQATHTTKVQFLLSSTGTDTVARLLGEDTNGNDGWTLAWRYPDEPLTVHLTVRAIGPGGTSPDRVLGLYHPGPNS